MKHSFLINPTLPLPFPLNMFCESIFSSLHDSWERLKMETETSGRVHIGLAQTILDEIHHAVKEFREQQRDIRKKV